MICSRLYISGMSKPGGGWCFLTCFVFLQPSAWGSSGPCRGRGSMSSSFAVLRKIAWSTSGPCQGRSCMSSFRHYRSVSKNWMGDTYSVRGIHRGGRVYRLFLGWVLLCVVATTSGSVFSFLVLDCGLVLRALRTWLLESWVLLSRCRRSSLWYVSGFSLL